MSQNQTAMTWTPERIEALINLWKGGVLTPEIARRLCEITPEAGPVSKGAVIGKRARLGLPERVATRPKAPQRNVLDLDGARCMFPIGHPSETDFHFCGDVLEEGKHYCAKHWAQTHEKRSSPKYGQYAIR